MAPCKINSIEFEGDGYGSECLVTHDKGVFRFGGGRIIGGLVQLRESSSEKTIILQGEFGAEMHVDATQKQLVEGWAQRTGTCVGY